MYLPASVSVSPRVLRWNSLTPKRSSSRLIYLVTALAEMNSFSAALRKLPQSATVIKVFRCQSYTGEPFFLFKP